MRLLIQLDSSFLSQWDGRSNYGGYFYLGWNQKDNETQKINGAIAVTASILPLVVMSVVEAELGAAFYNGKKGKIIRGTFS